MRLSHSFSNDSPPSPSSRSQTGGPAPVPTSRFINIATNPSPPSISKGLLAGVAIISILGVIIFGALLHVYLLRRRRQRGSHDIETPPTSAALSGRFSRFSGKDLPQFVVVPFHVPNSATTSESPMRSSKEREASSSAFADDVAGAGPVPAVDDARLSRMVFEAPPAYADSVDPSDFDVCSANPSFSSMLTYRTVALPSPLRQGSGAPWAGSSSGQSSPVIIKPSKLAQVYPPDVKIAPCTRRTSISVPKSPKRDGNTANDTPTQEEQTHVEPPPQLHLRAQTPFQMHFRESTLTPPTFDLKSLRPPMGPPDAHSVHSASGTRSGLGSAHAPSSFTQSSIVSRPQPNKSKSRSTVPRLRAGNDNTEMRQLSVNRGDEISSSHSHNSPASNFSSDKPLTSPSQHPGRHPFAHIPAPPTPATISDNSLWRSELVRMSTAMPVTSLSRRGTPTNRTRRSRRSFLAPFASFLPDMGEGSDA